MVFHNQLLKSCLHRRGELLIDVKKRAVEIWGRPLSFLSFRWRGLSRIQTQNKWRYFTTIYQYISVGLDYKRVSSQPPPAIPQKVSPAVSHIQWNGKIIPSLIWLRKPKEQALRLSHQTLHNVDQEYFCWTSSALYFSVPIPVRLQLVS